MSDFPYAQFELTEADWSKDFDDATRQINVFYD